MSNQQVVQKQDSKFFIGFLLGAIVGALVVFLFATEKGKRIWKIISEKGFKDFQDILDEDEEEQEIKTQPRLLAKTSNESMEEKPHAARRFFRGIHRHLN
jgi:gas vesicle protein